ncbi:PLP-dependent aminotransferase family protein [Mesorhizobium sp. WSM3224]|uniref:aminotransferase-like domain-containing protein n=1 Tax=Mesorhizobium sp. WSM3224 TaxID=1040986 RepID=UPI0003F8D59F|nr:PLP-dependent aminotransferase family protein [Mesorhizobium sp. WSM3224]
MVQISDNSDFPRPRLPGPQQIIDFSRSIPPLPEIFARSLQATLTELSLIDSIGLTSRNSIAGGSLTDRAAARIWLQSRLPEPITPERLLVTNGTQSALLLLFEAIIGQGGLLAAEALSYGVLAQLAKRAHIRIAGLELDRDGIEPSFFEYTCKTRRPKALYCNPTVHNPTATVMSKARRKIIVEIARRYSVTILEDEPLGCLHPDAPEPLARIAPDITWYVAGLTKGLAHGLRIAYVVGPSERDMEVVVGEARRLSHWFPSPIATTIVNSWITSGVAEQIRQDISREAVWRQQLAEAVLSGHDMSIQHGGLHAWLLLPQRFDQNEFARKLAGNNVLVRSSDAFAVDPLANCTNAIRVSLSSPTSRDEVEHGLHLIASSL